MSCNSITENCQPRVVQSFRGPPGAAGPTGGIQGPETTVVGRVVIWDNTSGTVVAQASVLISDLVTNAALATALSGKVNTETGKGLSTNDLTTALLNKLNALSAGTFRGTYANQALLESGVALGTEGDYAYVVDLTPDPGAEQQLFIWDFINTKWVAVAKGSTPSNGAEIKAALFAEADTNNLTDTLLAKLNLAATTTYVDSVIATLSGAASPNNNIITEATAARTLSVNDTFKYIRLTNAGACAITLPNDATATWTLTPFIGFRVTTVAPTLVLGAGVVVNGIANLAGLVADDNFSLKKVGVDQWDLCLGGCW